MIQDMDETIRQILVKKGKLNGGDIDISFDQPTGEWAGSLTRPTINCYLYDIRENVELRSRDWKVERENGISRRVMDPLRIDLSYIVTVWTRNIEDEHRLLWRVLHTLAAQKSILAADAEGALLRQPYNMPTKVALPSEAIRNLPDLWGVMENQLRPAINYVITVALDIGEMIEAPIVTTARFDVGPYTTMKRVDGQPIPARTEAVVDSLFHVGGRLFRGKTPAANASISMVDHPFEVISDADGRYVFASIPPGDYTLRIQTDGQKSQTLKISVPSESYDLKLKEPKE